MTATALRGIGYTLNETYHDYFRNHLFKKIKIITNIFPSIYVVWISL